MKLARIQQRNLFGPREKTKLKIPVALPLFLNPQKKLEESWCVPDYFLIDSRTGITKSLFENSPGGGTGPTGARVSR
jgi:hypothetical protein